VRCSGLGRWRIRNLKIVATGWITMRQVPFPSTLQVAIRSRLGLSALTGAEAHSLRRFAPQHVERVSKNQNFRLKPCSRPEQPGQRACQQPEKIYHRERASPDSGLLASRMRFQVGTGTGALYPPPLAQGCVQANVRAERSRLHGAALRRD
jgi:hypothetical protein